MTNHIIGAIGVFASMYALCVWSKGWKKGSILFGVLVVIFFVLFGAQIFF